MTTPIVSYEALVNRVEPLEALVEKLVVSNRRMVQELPRMVAASVAEFYLQAGRMQASPDKLKFVMFNPECHDWKQSLFIIINTKGEPEFTSCSSAMTPEYTLNFVQPASILWNQAIEFMTQVDSKMAHVVIEGADQAGEPTLIEGGKSDDNAS